MKTIEPIFGSDILMRPFRKADAGAFANAAIESMSTVGVWMPWCHPGYSIADATAWIRECEQNLKADTAYDLGIFSIDEKNLLGGVSLNQFNSHYNFGNLGYWVRQSAQRKGIASKAVRFIKNFAFDQVKLTRLEIVIIEDNYPSRRVAEKAGAVFEGTARNRLIKDDRPCTAAIYSLIPESKSSA
jgi:ribosomal-protein-serine acetyltransferase